MIAIDANVLLRFLVDDDAGQAAKARRVITQGDVVLLTTVVLETYWALCARYGLKRDEALDALKAVAGLDGVILQDAEVVVRAIELAERGLEFADAIHVASARGCAAFVTFDKSLVKRAAGMAAPKVRAP